jgi:cell division protein ZapE
MKSLSLKSTICRTYLRVRSFSSNPQEVHLPSILTLQSVYASKVADGHLDFDENQFKLIKLLNKISTYLVDQDRKILEPLIKKDIEVEGKQSDVPIEEVAEFRARGLYIYGDVGIGKTVVMDMFYDNCDIQAKKRVHFHQFMLDIHNRIHLYKKGLLQKYGRDIQLNMSSERDAITQVAESISNDCKLLCFDEFQVTDICDAMILSKLFSVLWSKGTVLIATSNRPPSDLYKDGLNRAYFTPFIKRLERECIVKEMASSKDYRQLNKPLENSYFTPLNDEAKNNLWESFKTHSYKYRKLNEELYIPGKQIEMNIPVMMGRNVKVTTLHETSTACYVDFKYLCETDRGASDYHAICKHYDTVFLYGIPVLSVLEHDRARRFITLIDEIYDAGVHLVWAADSEPNTIFKELTPVEIIIEKKEGKKFGTDHNWGADPNMIPGIPKTTNKSTNEWLDQASKTDIYPAVSRKFILIRYLFLSAIDCLLSITSMDGSITVALIGLSIV